MAVELGWRTVTEASINATVTGSKLTGKKVAVSDGADASLVLVLAKDAGRIGLYLVAADGDGVQVNAVKVTDRSRPTSTIVFDNAVVEELSTEDGWTAYQSLLDRAAVLIAFEQVGGAQACLEMARDYSLERFAFGRPIGSFQAIKHKLADAYVATELARSNAYYGAWALNADAAELPVAAATARVAGCRAFDLASKENIQTHGGMGFTWELDCHLYYRRAKHLGLVLGSARLWKNRLVSQLQTSNVA